MAVRLIAGEQARRSHQETSVVPRRPHNMLIGITKPRKLNMLGFRLDSVALTGEATTAMMNP